ncbi:unnamed protein product [Mytilus coruscus]|uniref:G-protein coupled receptors family 1 profile domain-containing protein n=1 Tax=Mytilus coruscus TaxID=42192 RepID=A0A6J8EX60_MYTCO|nr:unnamed protein product [Mytilus coruscus]
MLFTLYARVPFGLNVVAGPAICYISTVMNIMIFVILLDKKIRSPSTVVMQGLAIADGLTALSTYGMEPIFNLFYAKIGIPGSPSTVSNYHSYKKRIYTSILETQNLVELRYPYCVVHYCLSHMAENFHLVSILLTASLGIQKLLAIALPIWSRVHITNRKSAILCGFCFLFSMTLNIPRMFVVSIQSSENGDTCFVSQPQTSLEKYVLTIYPVLFSVLLTLAISVMLSSACYIVVILCRRKKVRGHSTSSKCEKKSCVLILFVVIIFLLSELPRLFIYGTVFKTFIFDTQNENIASTKAAKEIEFGMLACHRKIQDQFISELNIIREISSCVRVANGSDIQFEIESYVDYSREWSGYMWLITDEIEDKIKRNYYDLVSNAGQLTNALLASSSSRKLRNFYTTLFCNQLSEDDIYWIISDYEDRHTDCKVSIFPLLFHILPFLILGSSPYAEPMNYILNIIWGNITISLDHLKLLMEVLKISMIIGCASNFIIYMIMSEKLRLALLRRLRFWRHPQSRNDA